MKVEETTMSLKIPEKVALRNEIRRVVDDYFRDHPALPPVTWEELSQRAAMLMHENQWDSSHMGFIMLCCGNSIWRRIVAAIPYGRRILLLPQCLKNSRLCRAGMDNIGLLCNDCGNCSIAEILHEAENLGYVALVTEGTTIATRLIGSGKVDAVIGIGCMEVLQKMFRSVSKFAVPGIGIPLLSCGCKDTKADLTWIREELYCFREDPDIRLLNLNHIRNQTDSLFGVAQLQRLLSPGKDETVKIVIDSLLVGGQRIRPFLAALAYEAFSKEPDAGLLNRLVLSVECFHKASLIHDDIEDNDDERYGKQTIHAQYGIPVAINAGDLLIGEGYRIIAESGLPPAMTGDCIRVIATGHRAMTLGQGAELLATMRQQLCTMTEVLEIFEHKTASAFRVALLLGAIMGGADANTLDQLEKFSQYTGIAYQIMDDLEDHAGQRGDIRFRKPSVMMAMLVEELPPDEQTIIEQAFIAGNFNLIYLYLENYKTKDRCAGLLKQHLELAKESLDQLGNMGLKLALHEILGKIFDRYL